MGTYNDEDPNALDADGWRTVLFDGFNGGSIDRDTWPVLYGGDSGNGGAFEWSNDDTRVGDGELTVSMTDRGGWWTAGGLSQGWEGQTYGRFEVRAKVDPGQGTQGVVVLWPTDNAFPPEIDILETPRGDRSQAWFTNHWDGGDGLDLYEGRAFDVDASQWHTYAVDWTPERLTYYIDGREMYSTTENVPQEPMALSFSGWVSRDDQGWYGGGPDGSTPEQVDLHVDWARISVADGASQGGGSTELAPVAEEPGPVEAENDPPEAEEPIIVEVDDAPEAEEQASDPAPAAEAEVDWEALAAQVMANFEATGQWFI